MSGTCALESLQSALRATMSASPPPRKRRKMSSNSWTMPAENYEHRRDEVASESLSSCLNFQPPMTDGGSALKPVSCRECRVHLGNDGGDDGQHVGVSLAPAASSHAHWPTGDFEILHVGQIDALADGDGMAAATRNASQQLPSVALLPPMALPGTSREPFAPNPHRPRTNNSTVAPPSGAAIAQTLLELPASMILGGSLEAAMPNLETIDASFFPSHVTPANALAILGESRLLSTTELPVYSFTPEDALAVDDPLRNYDVAGFIDRWRIRSSEDREAPFFRSGRRSGLAAFPRPEYVLRRQDRPGQVPDVQGIEWNLLGPSRADAAQARACFHPSRLTFESRIAGKCSVRPFLPLALAERRYQFRSFAATHPPQINHYQLRNNLAAASRNEIYYVAKHSIRRLSLACPTYFHAALDFTATNPRFQPSCLAVCSNASQMPYQQHTVLIAGDTSGKYVLCNTTLASSKEFHGAASTTYGVVSPAENGLVTHIDPHAARRTSAPRAAFSTNDGQLRLLDLTTARFVQSAQGRRPINCSAVSSDGRLRALARDHRDVSIVDADGGGGKPLVRLRHHTDYAFACAWAPDGRYLATAAQDGAVALWDARRWDRPACGRATLMSAAAALRFTDAGELLVAESDDVVSVYTPPGHGSARVQDLHFFGAVAGLALVEGGREVVVANADRNVGGVLAWERFDSDPSPSCSSSNEREGSGGRVGEEGQQLYSRTRGTRGARHAELDFACI